MEISKTKEDLEYEKAKLQAEEYYKSIKSVKCPAFNGEEVFFTSEGFNHILYRIKKQERELRAQLTRFKLLPLAKELLAKTHTFTLMTTSTPTAGFEIWWMKVLSTHFDALHRGPKRVRS